MKMTEPRARKTDPLTSHEAARKARHWAGTHKERIYHALRDMPDRRAINDQISEATGLDHNQISRRLVEMEREGLIHRDGKIRQNSRGYDEEVWVLGPGDRKPLAQPKSALSALRRENEALRRENMTLRLELEKERRRRPQLSLGIDE